MVATHNPSSCYPFYFIILQKTQSLSDQAWEKVRCMGIVQQGLETECSELKVQLDQYESEKTSLLYACSMLAGALYSLISR